MNKTKRVAWRKHRLKAQKDKEKFKAQKEKPGTLTSPTARL